MAARFDLIYWFSEVDKNDISLVGEKGTNIGDLSQAGFPLPDGFIISSRAYFNFLRENNLATKIKHLLSTVNYDQETSLRQVSQHIKKLILEAKQSKTLIDEVITAYSKLHNSSVMVSASVTTKNACIPLQETYFNLKGETNLLLKIKEEWASVFEAKAIAYRHERQFDHFRAGIGVVVQQRIEPEKAGEIFTIDPVTNDKSTIQIDAMYGSSDMLLTERIISEKYIVHKSSLKIANKNIVAKHANVKQQLTDEQIIALAALGKKLEHYYYFPQEIQWVIAHNKIFILRSHQLTTSLPSSTDKGMAKIEKKPSKKQQGSHKTTTKLYVNISNPDMAESIAKQQIDGVGLLRVENIITNIGVHPKKMIHDGRKNEYIKKLAEQIEMVSKAFNPRPVIYRTSDMKTYDYRKLVGGKEYEPLEINPLLGYRGAFRSIHDPEIFTLELEALKIVRNKKGLKNVWLMLPFVRTVRELIDIKRIITSVGLYRSENFKLFMLCETPNTVIMLDKFIHVGIDGVSIGSNDLIPLLLGIDPDNSEVAHAYDEQNESVLWALEHVITTCKKHNIVSSICGRAPSLHPDMLEKLIAWGITSISVDSRFIESTREHMIKIEK